MVSFNYWMGGEYAVIILGEGEHQSYSEGGPTEEGYDYTHISFTHEGDKIVMGIENTGRDCDGRIDCSSEFTCDLDKLAGHENPDGILVPIWERVSASQRDYSAEAAGY